MHVKLESVTESETMFDTDNMLEDNVSMIDREYVTTEK